MFRPTKTLLILMKNNKKHGNWTLLKILHGCMYFLSHFGSLLPSLSTAQADKDSGMLTNWLVELLFSCHQLQLLETEVLLTCSTYNNILALKAGDTKYKFQVCLVRCSVTAHLQHGNQQSRTFVQINTTSPFESILYTGNILIQNTQHACFTALLCICLCKLQIVACIILRTNRTMEENHRCKLQKKKNKNKKHSGCLRVETSQVQLSESPTMVAGFQVVEGAVLGCQLVPPVSFFSPG